MIPAFPMMFLLSQDSTSCLRYLVAASVLINAMDFDRSVGSPIPSIHSEIASNSVAGSSRSGRASTANSGTWGRTSCDG